LITPLPFDSDLFGYPVGKYEIAISWDENEFINAAERFELVYLFSKKLLDIQDARIQLVDTKLVFHKVLEAAEPILSIIRYDKKTLAPELKALAIQSGLFSRFKTDERLVNREFEKLYSLWIKKSLEQDLILCDPQLNGMITLALDQSSASIGLFAVSENSRGKGIGANLIQAAEHQARIAGAKSLKIATQEANQAACKLYSKTGYQVTDKVFVYHYWNPEN
jgi:ribosomal protein S18 acetylase RimI-like enzyme